MSKARQEPPPGQEEAPSPAARLWDAFVFAFPVEVLAFLVKGLVRGLAGVMRTFLP